MFENTGLIVLLPMQEYNANYIGQPIQVVSHAARSDRYEV